MNKLKSLMLKISRYIIHKSEDKELSNILDIASFEVIKNRRENKNKNVIFVIPEMLSGMGGLTSLLRVALRLSQNGYSIFYTSYNSDKIDFMSKNAKENLSNYQGKFVKFSEAVLQKFDFVVASNWQSVYYSKLIEGYKIYFVQDFEPYFYSLGDNYFLAKKAYELGFHIISLGKWNVEQIKENCNVKNVKIDYIDFPVEASEYKYISRDYSLYKNKKKIEIAVYIKRDPKRVPSLILNMLEKTYYSLKEKGYNLEINYFGLNEKEQIKVGNNLGKLNKKQLYDLYKKCNFGMVASMTNISLVPYEMLGTGLPVIEFEDGSYESFLGNDSSILIGFDYKELVRKIIYYIENPNELEKITNNGTNRIKNLSWDKSGEQLVKIFNEIR